MDESHGQESDRKARWLAALSEEERARVDQWRTSTSRTPGIPFRALPNAYLRVLYALAVAGEPLSPREITALMALRWDSHSDPSSVQRRLALAAQQEEVRSAPGGRYRLNREGWQRLEELEEGWLNARPRRRGRPGQTALPKRGRSQTTRSSSRGPGAGRAAAPQRGSGRGRRPGHKGRG